MRHLNDMTLAEVRAQLALMERDSGRNVADEFHASVCSHRPRCRTLAEDRADLALVRHLLANWFARIPGQQVLSP